MLKKTLIIDEAKWHRGKEDSALRMPSGKMCCLGFAGMQLCGLTAADMRGVGMPNGLEMIPRQQMKEHLPKLFNNTKWSSNNYSCNSGLCSNLAGINDRLDITDNERKKRIRASFKEHFGVTVRFTNSKKKANDRE